MNNLHTEEEARGKWCPHVRIADCGADNAVASNRSCSKEVNYKCIASECTAWQWKFNFRLADEHPDKGKESGYCGLASNGGDA